MESFATRQVGVSEVELLLRAALFQQGSALLGKARCAEQLGDKAMMIATYKEYLKDNPGSPLALKLAELEAANVSAPAAK